MLRSAYPPGGDPLDFPDTPQALVVVDSRNIVQWVARFRRAESSEIGVVADHSPALILSTASRSCDCSLSFRGRQTC